MQQEKINIKEVKQFTDRDKYMVFYWAREIQMNIYPSWDESQNPALKVPTPDGELTVGFGDYLVLDTENKLHVYKQDIFEAAYGAAQMI